MKRQKKGPFFSKKQHELLDEKAPHERHGAPLSGFGQMAVMKRKARNKKRLGHA